MKLERFSPIITPRIPPASALFLATALFHTGTTGAATTYRPVDSAELKSALQSVTAGDTIQLFANTTYTGKFVATAAGSADKPIKLLGATGSVLQSNSLTTGYALNLNGAQYWTLDGFTVTNSYKGVMLDRSNNNTLQNLTIYNIGQEGVHFRASSSYNTIQTSYIHDTGLTTPGYGEAIYIGSAVSNWDSFGGNGGSTADLSFYNNVISNRIGANVAAEGIDIKEGTFGGVIRGNIFEATGISGVNYADSVIDLKGSGYTVSGNVVNYTNPKIISFDHDMQASTPNVTRDPLMDGFQVHVVKKTGVTVTNTGTNNTFSANMFNLGGISGYGIMVQSDATGNIIYDDNSIVAGASKGLANVALTVTPVDEPSMAILMMIGCLLVGAARPGFLRAATNRVKA